MDEVIATGNPKHHIEPQQRRKMPKSPVSQSVLHGFIGREVGISRWTDVDQAMIDLFAKVTDDHQFIHVDAQAAARTPFGSTIAHGMLTLSLVPSLAQEALPPVAGTEMLINYGFEKVRFIAPVCPGSRIRGRFQLIEMTQRRPNEVLLQYDITIDLEHNVKPALVARWLCLSVLIGNDGNTTRADSRYSGSYPAASK